MPYTHFHNWRLHTHRRRPKGDRHYTTVRRQQRPFRVGVCLLGIGVVLGVGAWYAMTHDLLDQLDQSRDFVETRIEETREHIEEASATRTAENKAEAEAQQDAHERRVIELINIEREQRGIGTLAWDSRLQAIAKAHSEDMASKGYFEHTNMEGLDYRERAIAAGYRCPNPKWQGVAENLYFGGGIHQRPQAAVESWLGSPGHRRAMLDTTFSKAAIGVHEGYLHGYGDGYYTTLLLC